MFSERLELTKRQVKLEFKQETKGEVKEEPMIKLEEIDIKIEKTDIKAIHQGRITGRKRTINGIFKVEKVDPLTSIAKTKSEIVKVESVQRRTRRRPSQ